MKHIVAGGLFVIMNMGNVICFLSTTHPSAFVAIFRESIVYSPAAENRPLNFSMSNVF